MASVDVDGGKGKASRSAGALAHNLQRDPRTPPTWEPCSPERPPRAGTQTGQQLVSRADP
eukprot:9293060-Pyramimonas_sp.AAC.1